MAVVCVVVLGTDKIERKHTEGWKYGKQDGKNNNHALRVAIEHPFVTRWTPRDCDLDTSRDLRFDVEDGEDKFGREMEGWEIGGCFPFR